MTRGQLPRGRSEGRALLAAGGVDPADHERGLRRVFALAFASCERKESRDAAARDVSAVTARVHIEVSAPARVSR